MESINTYTDRIKASGYKVTSVRKAILSVLVTVDGHITSSELLHQIEQKHPKIGRASVFRTLDLFSRLNIIRPAFSESSVTPSYYLVADGHHHHIICSQCNDLIHFDTCDLNHLTQQLSHQFDFQINGHLLEFYGLCSNCHQSN